MIGKESCLSVHSEPSSLGFCDRSEDSTRFPNFWKLPFFSAADNSSSSFRLFRGLVSLDNSLAISCQVRSDIGAPIWRRALLSAPDTIQEYRGVCPARFRTGGLQEKLCAVVSRLNAEICKEVRQGGCRD